LIVHVLDHAMLMQIVDGIPALAQTLIARFWPGALTLVLRKAAAVPELLSAGLPTVAVRMPSHPVARALLRSAGLPLAAPSANPFGYLSPTRAQHVVRMLGERVDLVLDGGPSTHGIESTILMVEPQPALLRAGAIAAETIEAAIGPLARDVAAPAPLAPGQLPAHYAPHTPMRLVDPSEVPLAARARAGALTFREPVAGYAAQRLLSASGDLREAAAALFESLHALDDGRLERIDCQPVPEHGLGMAIMDRLRRAAARP
jgi:L-threonylcarbamoyladenylate synthase